MTDIFQTREYKEICKFYGDRRAKRSQVPLINHIHEGLEFMRQRNASWAAMRAYCLHPLFQGDVDLKTNFGKATILDPYVIMLVLEYRSVANEYLSARTIKDISEIRLSPLPEVNAMLVADKMQNFKDFMIYHHGTHSDSAKLFIYFRNWFDRLGIDRAEFDKLAADGKKTKKYDSPSP